MTYYNILSKFVEMKTQDYQFQITPNGNKFNVKVKLNNLNFPVVAEYEAYSYSAGWGLTLISGEISKEVYNNLRLFVQIWLAGRNGQGYFWNSYFENSI